MTGLLDLTRREFEFVVYISYGMTRREIADKCNVDPATVRSILYKAYKLLEEEGRHLTNIDVTRRVIRLFGIDARPQHMLEYYDKVKETKWSVKKAQ